MNKMPIKLKAYTGTIILIGMIFLFIGIKEYSAGTNIVDVFFFITLAIITESFKFSLKSDKGLSGIFAIGLTTVLVFNPFIASIITAIGIFFKIDYRKGQGIKIFGTDLYKNLFNGCAYAICAATSGLVYYGISKYSSFMIGKLNIVGIIAATIVYVFANAFIYNGLMAIIEEKKLKETLLNDLWVIRNLLAISPLGVIIALAYLSFGKFAVVLFFVPLLLARYSFKLYIDMRHVYFETIKALSNAVEAKDKYTIGHSYRVADYAVGIAEQMGLSGNKVEQIKTAAILHDIGKIGIADSILNKSGHLEEKEYIVIQEHPQIGSKILSEVDFLAEVANIIKYHHERYDGKGYPEGLTAAEIPIEASILSVADAYDAMTSDRPYRKAMDRSVAARVLIKESGIQFNPIVVRAFQEYLNSNKIEVISHVS